MPQVDAKALASLAAPMVLLAVSTTPADAFYDVHLVEVPFIYDSTDPVVIEFDVAGHNPALGALQAVSMTDLLVTTGGSLTWVGTNNTGSAQANQRIRIRTDESTIVKSNTLSIDSGVSFHYSDPFDLNAGESYPFVHLPGSGSGGTVGNDMTPALLQTFETAGTVTLRLETSLTAETYPTPGQLDFDEPTGSMNASYTLSLAFKYQATSAPDATPIAVGQSATGNFNGQEIRWYELTYNGGDLTIDTLGSNDGPGGTSDTTLGLYNALGELIDSNDDGPGFTGDDEYLSQLVFADGDLANGTYYIAVGLYEVEYESGNFNADPSAADLEFGSYKLNVVPEPATGAMCLLLMAPLLRRRRVGL